MPLDDCDDDGGPLKSIAAFALAGTPSVPASVATLPPPAPVVATPSVAPQPVARTPQPSARRHANLRTPSMSAPKTDIIDSNPQNTQQRHENYTSAQFDAAWDAAMAAFPGHHILVNTMRSCRPAHTQDHRYVMTVENTTQVQTVTEALPRILALLRDNLHNDSIIISVKANEGDASPDTWNDRQVLSDMLEHNPHMNHFVTELKLTIT